MKGSKIMGYGLLHAALAAAYITMIATIVSNGNELFGKKDGALSAIAFLLTFVLSAAIMGIIIFGRPILWYLNGAKKEAVQLIFSTIIFLAVITGIVFTVLLINKPA